MDYFKTTEVGNGTNETTPFYDDCMSYNFSRLKECHGSDMLIYWEERSPIKYALPLYGFVVPIFVAITVFTNTFIAVVLTRRHLRTPTNYVLLAMAITELWTGLISTPWFMYFYTFRGYLSEREHGTPEFWCFATLYMVQYLPTFFHTCAVWLTVFLAIQRYIYVCVPSLVPSLCTRGRTKFCIFLICFAAFLAELPVILISSTKTIYMSQTKGGIRRPYCLKVWTGWILKEVSLDVYMASLYWFQAIFIHLVPCILLAIFTGALIRAIRSADRRRRRSLFRRPHGGARVGGNGSPTTCLKYFHATTQMLVVVILIFLVIEIPAAAIFIFHTLIQFSNILPHHHYKSWMHLVAVSRNALIIVSYPFNFAIYCGMSQQFRFTVRQLFSRRPLFIQQPVANHNGGGKRYSVILVDINEFRTLRNKGKLNLRNSIKIIRGNSPSAIREEGEEANRVIEVNSRGNEISSNCMNTFNVSSTADEEFILSTTSRNGISPTPPTMVYRGSTADPDQMDCLRVTTL